MNFRDAYSDDYNSEDTEKIEIKKLEVEEEPLDPKIAEAIFCFNKKWKTGISLLESEGIITQDKKSIANFLFKYNDKLSKSELGEILAGKDDNVELLIEFTELLNFTGVSFAEGLRSYLTKFLLPGEAQKISRMMEVFAGKYLKDNPTTFPDTDCAFILAFALIMLNTDAHNPAILEKDKMTKAQFVQNSRGTWHGNDPPQELLEMLYDEIVGNEIQMKTKGDPDKKGWVKSIKGSLFEQNKRWLCLIGNELRWYKNPTRGRPEDPEKPLGYIKLEYVMVNEMDDRFCISSTLPKNIEFYVYEEKKPVAVTTLQFEITCESAAQVEHWAAAVRKNVTFEVEPEFDPKHYKKPKSKAKNFKKTKKF
uniref:SEC7 domain-containing protein n=1 Tax=Arcella intermedia TaxID=1963864 RepID=A0A6B2L769_9EUKA